ncbi:RepB family plasmid replication initiator protein [Helicobacter sp. UBA3407]|uniref:RepB family plasmid replication initiator protein n=1 Tax=Helicobacter sp. UBA3407 TaxID=1946588 RepID=UPI00260B7FBE|nr:RepB family plasmid replication initiator protein [Helicobacter sp. UBA3407]
MNLIKDRRVCNKLKYGNEINSIEFFDFTAQDFNLFFTICWHIKQKKSKKIAISFDELKEFMPDIKNNRRFYNEICKLGISNQNEVL